MSSKKRKKTKVALVLGGGGARGLAHIGVLKVLEREQIPIDLIVGTSAGALIGAMYCQLTNAPLVEKRMVEFIDSEVYEESGLNKIIKKQETENFIGHITHRLKEQLVANMVYSRQGLVKRERLRKVIDYLVADEMIEDCKIPFAAVAVDLVEAKEVILTSGSIRLAVEASSALPGYFPPVKLSGKRLVDGAVLQVMPIPSAKQLGAEFIIAVNVSQNMEVNPSLENVVDIVFRASSVTNDRYNQILHDRGDVILRPDIGTFHWSDFSKYSEAIKRGELVAEKAIPLIKKKLNFADRKFGSLFRKKRAQILVDGNSR